MLDVQIAAVSPYGLAFASASASSKSPTRCRVVIGPKSSVRRELGVLGHVLDDRRADVEAAVVVAAGQPLAAGEHGRAGRARPLDGVEHVLELAFVDHGPKSCSSRRADALRPRALEQQLAEAVVDGVEHDQARARRAALAGVREGRERGRLRRPLQVGVVADDERVLAAELEADLGEPLSGRLARSAVRRRSSR